MAEREYFLGLDIGTDSVGWAVTDEQYNLLKFRGEPAWGLTLFDAANPASDRRGFRVARRRLDRRQQRVSWLQELFAPVIAPIDPRFFLRQAESRLYPEDRGEPYALFNDDEFTDREYHGRYPTIHHLIVDLMHSDAPHDPRLIYLACAWLVAHRGHFLNQIDRNNVEAVTDFGAVYAELREYLLSNEYAIPWREDHLEAMADALKQTSGVTRKLKALCMAAFSDGKAPKEHREDFPYRCDLIMRALSGGKVSAADLFGREEYKEIEQKSFSLDMDDESLEKLYQEIGDDAELIRRLKAIFDWSILVQVLGDGEGGERTISGAKVRVYEQHKRDLAFLKAFIKKYLPEKFDDVFRNNTLDNYVAYTGHGGDENTKRCNQEAFCKAVAKWVKGVTPEEEDRAQFEDMLSRLETQRFMPKQVNGDNRVIPYQLYWYELDKLLKRAEGYSPWLQDISDQIRAIFTFRVPYFVGPLGRRGKNVWASRADGRILPWNFEEQVDLDMSESEFIRRLTNRCTYLPGEDVLPKDSLLYHRFTVLNELNNLKINDRPISVGLKQAIFNDVFMAHPKVTRKHIENYLKSNNHMGAKDQLSGIDITIKSNLKPWFDFKRLMLNDTLSEADVEAIIERRTYSEESGRFTKWLRDHYPQLPEGDMRYISRLKYADFGRLSRRFLNDFEGVDRQTGEVFTVMRALWETNDNLRLFCTLCG